jgi:DeoR/GlpR family transcriptional regulator of sugar metabolism
MSNERNGGPLSPRHQELLTRLQDQTFVRVRDLAAAFSLDPMTIRRDLRYLSARGLVERLHGGCRLTQRGAFDRAFAEKERSHRAAKESIGERAADWVQPGQVVLIDTGTTPLAVARALAHRQIEGVTVITTSLPVLWELYDAPHLRVIALGGDLQRETGQLYGPMTESLLATLKVDLAFMGADGIDERGSATCSPESCRLAAAMWQIARQPIVVADASKLELGAPYIYASLEGSRLITDRLTPEQQQKFRQAGLQIDLAG